MLLYAVVTIGRWVMAVENLVEGVVVMVVVVVVILMLEKPSTDEHGVAAMNIV